LPQRILCDRRIRIVKILPCCQCPLPSYLQATGNEIRSDVTFVTWEELLRLSPARPMSVR
jgi:hypothetical protein